MNTFKPKSTRNMTEIERAWIGAIIDAEGHIKVDRYRNFPRLSVANTDIEIISALLRITGVGGVHENQNYRNGGKHCFVWIVSRANDVMDIVKQCKPFSPKFQRFNWSRL